MAYMNNLFLTCSVILLLASATAAQDRVTTETGKYYIEEAQLASKNYFSGGGGLSFSSKYKEALQASEPDREVSGPGIWLHFDVGFGFQVAPRIFITPHIGMLATSIEYESSFGSAHNSRKATILFLPSVGGKYLFAPEASTLFACADIGLVAPVSDLDYPDLKSSGVAFGMGIGYSWDREYELTLHYRYIPVKTTVSPGWTDEYSGSMVDSESSNYGGIGFTFWRLFSI